MIDISVGKWRIRRLTDDSRVMEFASGDADMDDFIINRSHLYLEQRLSANHVLTSGADVELPIAFFTLSCDKVCMSDFATNTEFNRFRRKRFVNSKRMKGFPAIKIGRIAVAADYQGQGVGSLIIEAIKFFISSVRYVGCRFITVDAYKSRITLYRRYGFEVLCTSAADNDSRTCQMYYDLLNLKD